MKVLCMILHYVNCKSSENANFGAAVVNLMQHGDGLPLGDTTYTEPVQSCGGADIDILIDM